MSLYHVQMVLQVVPVQQRATMTSIGCSCIFVIYTPVSRYLCDGSVSSISVHWTTIATALLGTLLMLYDSCNQPMLPMLLDDKAAPGHFLLLALPNAVCCAVLFSVQFAFDIAATKVSTFSATNAAYYSHVCDLGAGAAMFCYIFCTEDVHVWELFVQVLESKCVPQVVALFAAVCAHIVLSLCHGRVFTVSSAVVQCSGCFCLVTVVAITAALDLVLPSAMQLSGVGIIVANIFLVSDPFDSDCPAPEDEYVEIPEYLENHPQW